MEHWYQAIKLHESRQWDLTLEARRERLARAVLAHGLSAENDGVVVLLRRGLEAMMVLCLLVA